jgi:hypothetical protein
LHLPAQRRKGRQLANRPLSEQAREAIDKLEEFVAAAP